MVKKIIYLFFSISFMIFFLSCDFSFEKLNAVNFNDSTFEKEIRFHLRKNEKDILTIEDLKKVIWFIPLENIKDFSDIKYCTELESIMLNNQIDIITDFSPFTKLTKIRTFILPRGNNISSVEFVSSFKGLEDLWLSNNAISDITPLSNLKNMYYLILNNNNISDITPLSNLNNLRELILNNNNISDISSLSDKLDLEKLVLNNNNISDITPLSKLTKLKYLALHNNNILDLAPLMEIYKNGGFKTKPFISVFNNNLDLRPGTPNREVVEKLYSMGIHISCRGGNIIE